MGTLAAAADNVGLSQPALTQGIAKLERRLGAAFRARRGKRVKEDFECERGRLDIERFFESAHNELFKKMNGANAHRGDQD